MSEDGSTLARRQLGKYLRDGRHERGLTLHQAADLIQRSASTLQRIEKGTVAKLREVDLEALCQIYEFDADHTAAMKGLAAQSNEESWWYEFDDLLPADFNFYVGLEASARRLTTYESELVPGVLQTPAYAGALFHTGYPDDSADEHARRVQLRLRRQARIMRKHSPVILDVVMRESVLRGVVGGPRIMAAQLKHLADISTRSNVNLRVLPFSAGFPLGEAIGSFVVLEFGTDKEAQPVEPPVVYTESFTGDLYLAKPVAVRRYHEAYECLRQSALDAVASRAPASADREGVCAVMDELTNAKWFKSSRSGASKNCVEVAFLPKRLVGVRDSKQPSGPALVFTTDEWSAFVDAADRGRFDG